jgi:hypothetical protein
MQRIPNMTATASELARAAFDQAKATKVVGSTPVSDGHDEPDDQALRETGRFNDEGWRDSRQ